MKESEVRIMSDGTVGTVKLGVELDADISKSLNKVADTISSKIKSLFETPEGATKIGEAFTKSMEKSMDRVEKVMSNVDTTMEQTVNKVDAALQKMINGISKAVGILIEKLKALNLQQINPRPDVIPNVTDKISIPQPRAPPVKTGIKADMQYYQDQIAIIQETINLQESAASSHVKRVKELEAQYKKTAVAMKNVGGKITEVFDPNAPGAKKIADQIAKENIAIDKIGMSVNSLNSKLGQTERHIKSLQESSSKATNSVSKSVSKTNQQINSKLKGATSKAFKGMRQAMLLPFKPTIIGVKRLGRAAQSAGEKGTKSLNTLDKSFWKVFKRLFIIGMISKMLKGLTGYIGDALMANERYRASLDTVKLNLAAAFQPIMDIIVPALVNLMAWLAKATGYMAAFIATMFGTTYKASVEGARQLNAQTTAYKEMSKQSQKTASKVKKSAKEMIGSLAGFDEINTISLKTDKVDTGADEASKAPSWATAATTEIGDTSKFDKFKDILKGIFKPFQESWANEGQNTIKAFKYAMGEISELAKSVGRSLYEVWTNGTGTEMLDSIQRLLQNILYLIGDIAKSFRLAWDDEGRGTQIIQNIADGIINTIKLFESITASIREVWGVVGDEIAVNCLDILKNVTHLFAEIPKTFKESWDKNKIGTEFLQHIGNGFNNILGLISQVTGAMDGLWAKFGPSITDTVMQCMNATGALFESMTIGFRGVWDNGGNHLFESIGRLATRLFELAGRIYSEFIAPTAGKFLEILGPAIGKVLDIIASLLDKFSELIEWLLQDGNPAFEILGATITSVGIMFLGYKAKILAAEVATKLFTRTTEIAATVSGVFSKAIAFLCTPMGLVAAAIGAIIAIGILLYKHWDELGPRLRQMWEKAKQFFGNLVKSFFEHKIKMVAETAKYLSAIGIMILSALGQIIVNITKLFGEFLRVGGGILQSLMKGMGMKVPQALKIITDLGRNLCNIMSRINLFNIGKNLIQGLWNGISSVTDWILDQLGGFCDRVVDAVKDWFGIASPSKVFKNEIGKWIPRGMAIGIEAETDKVSKAMDGLMEIPALRQPELSFMGEPRPPQPPDKDSIVKEILEIMNGGDDDKNPQPKPIHVTLEVDGEVIGKKSVEYIDDVQKRIGRPVFG
jgi:phage-related protein